MRDSTKTASNYLFEIAEGQQGYFTAKQAAVGVARVGLGAEREMAAGVLPNLAGAVPVEAKLRDLLARGGFGCGVEAQPHPSADDGSALVKVRPGILQEANQGGGFQLAVEGAGVRVNRQAGVGLGVWRLGFRVWGGSLGSV
ncbi:MAG: hypothetical protein RLY20_1412 [Verrucomicrobiota bacterium]